MSTFTFRPATRENTPLIIGIAGPTKSGKTFSAHRLSRGLVGDKPDPRIIMLNAEGARGHQYADEFSYIACDIAAPFGPDRYAEAVSEIHKQSPDALIIDSCSHMHDGPGGLLEWHERELDRMAGTDYKKREKCTWAAWIKPKAAENAFIYAMLSLDCPVILCFRAKEKLKIVPGKDPVDLGWQPIAGDRITFETIFTLVLPPHSKGVPDLAVSEMRKPFDTMVPGDKPIDEALGRKLAAWARGGAAPAQPVSLACDAEDWKDISTATSDAGLSSRAVSEHIVDGMGFAKPRDLTKSRKGELLKWIKETTLTPKGN